MKVAIRVLKVLLVLCSLGWAYLNFKWIVFIAEAYKFLQSANETTEIHQTSTADFWPNVQIIMTMFGP